MPPDLQAEPCSPCGPFEKQLWHVAVELLQEEPRAPPPVPEPLCRRGFKCPVSELTHVTYTHEMHTWTQI